MHRVDQYGVLLLAADKCDHGIFDFARRLNDRFLVLHQCLLQTRILHSNIVFDATVIQEWPDERRPNGVGQTLGAKQLTDAALHGTCRICIARGCQAERATDAETRIQTRFGDADLRILRHSLQLRAPHIGPLS